MGNTLTLTRTRDLVCIHLPSLIHTYSRTSFLSSILANISRSSLAFSSLRNKQSSYWRPEFLRDLKALCAKERASPSYTPVQ